ncbi:FAD-dependent oxidoreductase [Polynucleobacter sp. AP-Titi-500A-B4]|uniref:FAD-dependent oxidoreductase n=1 Tax=Polynucleobacter sp. AP-Titi-500A-B4 TaxID=2576923 RepID=UPI001BFDD14A|nr:FAD-dependent oxidoreductase [Polynucleobacter sp. AP-Titi-500A-B4]QWE13398.1 FAD-dependent oxidoreductase [Polynucleobacter sp. AP-Titi-500A-B4]
MTQASRIHSKYAIVGAGLMGRLLAVALAQRGAQVDIFDQGNSDGSGAAARIAAAMLAPLAESAITEDSVVRMGIHSLPRWKQLIGGLSTPVFFQQDGTLILWHRQDASEAERFTNHLEKNCLHNPQLTLPQKLDSMQLREIEPGVAERFMQGLFLPNEGQLDNRQLLDALLQELNVLKVNCLWNKEVDPEKLRKDSQYQCVIDCRGNGAKEVWASSINSLRGVRGEVVRLYAPEVKLRRPTRLIHPRYPIYIAPKENDVYVVGATEIESDDLSEMSVRSAMELLSAVYTVHSGFAEARILEMATQCRPTLKNNLPEIRIQKDKGLADLLMINGLYRHGFMISPAVLDSTLELLESGQSNTALELGLSITSNTSNHEASVCA